jgi:hypothetical protein
MIVTMKVAGTGGGTDQQKVDQLIEMMSGVELMTVQTSSGRPKH